MGLNLTLGDMIRILNAVDLWLDNYSCQMTQDNVDRDVQLDLYTARMNLRRMKADLAALGPSESFEEWISGEREECSVDSAQRAAATGYKRGWADAAESAKAPSKQEEARGKVRAGRIEGIELKRTREPRPACAARVSYPAPKVDKSPREYDTCRRPAWFILVDMPLCRHHAGELLLNTILRQSDTVGVRRNKTIAP